MYDWYCSIEASVQYRNMLTWYRNRSRQFLVRTPKVGDQPKLTSMHALSERTNRVANHAIGRRTKTSHSRLSHKSKQLMQ